MKKKLVAIIGAVTLISGCGWGPSKEEKKMAENACIEFIKEQFWVMTSDKEHAPKIFDNYTKKGKIVVKVGYKIVEYQGDRKAHSVRLCVVDIEKGTISLPSPLNDSEWKE